MFIFLKTLGNCVNVGTVLEIMVAVNAQFYLGAHHQMILDKSKLVRQYFDQYSSCNSG